MTDTVRKNAEACPEADSYMAFSKKASLQLTARPCNVGATGFEPATS
jgi:hypothetical protein